MKVLLATALLVGLAGSSVIGTSNEAAAPSAKAGLLSPRPLPSTNPGNIVALREVTLKAGVDPDVFERFVAEEFTPAFEKYAPGVRAFYPEGHPR